MSDIETQLIDRQTLVKLLRENESLRQQLVELAEQNQHLVLVLKDIGDFSHDRSQGPAVPDALWEVRRIAYEALDLPDLASPVLNRENSNILREAATHWSGDGNIPERVVKLWLDDMADAIEKGEA